MEKTLRFKLNGAATTIRVDADRPLLWVLRTDLGLTGPKYGCGEGICGACTVLVNGRPVRSCHVAVGEMEGREIVTIEGLARGGTLHPLQKAFMEHSALQCGFCTPGMIMSAAALLARNPDPSIADIVAAMDDNLCRCGSHLRIIRAVQAAAREMRGVRR